MKKIVLVALAASALASPALAQSRGDVVVMRRQIAPPRPSPAPTPATSPYAGTWATGEFSTTQTCTAAAIPTRSVTCTAKTSPYAVLPDDQCDPASRPSPSGTPIEIYTSCTTDRDPSSPSVCSGMLSDRYPTHRDGAILLGTVTRSTQGKIAQVARVMCESNVEARTSGRFYCYTEPHQNSSTAADVYIVKQTTVLSASGNPWELPYRNQAADYYVGDCQKR